VGARKPASGGGTQIGRTELLRHLHDACRQHDRAGELAARRTEGEQVGAE
jgi:hypothetical protein